jgi:hypothetical protein
MKKGEEYLREGKDKEDGTESEVSFSLSASD